MVTFTDTIHCRSRLHCPACRGTDPESIRQRETWVKTGLIREVNFPCPFGLDAARAALAQQRALIALCRTQEQFKAVAAKYRQAPGTPCAGCPPLVAVDPRVAAVYDRRTLMPSSAVAAPEKTAPAPPAKTRGFGSKG